jgi:hypothetical protein
MKTALLLIIAPSLGIYFVLLLLYGLKFFFLYSGIDNLNSHLLLSNTVSRIINLCWHRTVMSILIRIDLAESDPDPGAWKLTKIK